MHLPTLSVAVPVYQGSRFLESSLRSVLGQSYRDFEVCVVDDGSTDGSADIAERVADACGNGLEVRVLRNRTRLGLVGNWNRCLRVARGKYVLLFHQDDVLEPGMLERSVRVLEEQSELGFMYSTYGCIDEQDQELPPWSTSPFTGRIRGPALIEALLRENFICCPTVIVPRAIYDRVGGYDERFAFSADLEMWLRIAAQYDVFCCPQRGVRYRLHAAQATHPFRHARRVRGELEYVGAALVALKHCRRQHPELWRAVVRDNLWMFRQHVRADPTESLWTAKILLDCPGDALMATGAAVLDKCMRRRKSTQLRAARNGRVNASG